MVYGIRRSNYILLNDASSPIGLSAISSISSIRLMRSIVFQRNLQCYCRTTSLSLETPPKMLRTNMPSRKAKQPPHHLPRTTPTPHRHIMIL